jgi:hypothetical protein
MRVPHAVHLMLSGGWEPERTDYPLARSDPHALSNALSKNPPRCMCQDGTAMKSQCVCMLRNGKCSQVKSAQILRGADSATGAAELASRGVASSWERSRSERGVGRPRGVPRGVAVERWSAEAEAVALSQLGKVQRAHASWGTLLSARHHEVRRGHEIVGPHAAH